MLLSSSIKVTSHSKGIINSNKELVLQIVVKGKRVEVAIRGLTVNVLFYLGQPSMHKTWKHRIGYIFKTLSLWRNTSHCRLRAAVYASLTVVVVYEHTFCDLCPGDAYTQACSLAPPSFLLSCWTGCCGLFFCETFTTSNTPPFLPLPSSL